MPGLSQDFIEAIKQLLPTEAEELLKALDTAPSIGVRLNRRKPGASFPDSSPVPWCDSGLYLSERPEFIFDPLLHAGAYYVQDPSSMVYETVVAKLLQKFPSPYPTLRLLDLCAAPGGKTTAIINAIPDGCEIIANEYSRKRLPALRENLERWGYPFTKVTNKDSAFFASQGEQFDIVAVDAPCSGEGMMRKEPVARTQWSHELVAQCASLQKEILKNASQALKPGGFLIYSTCTFNREENECNAQFINQELNLSPIDLNFPEDWNIHKGIETDLPVYRFMPHKTKGEGLFLAVFQKPGEWIPSKIFQSAPIKDASYPSVEVDKETAIRYLRGESIKLKEDAPKGIVTVSYLGFPLGEAKNIGSRANNLYPKSKRIKKAVSQ